MGDFSEDQGVLVLFVVDVAHPHHELGADLAPAVRGPLHPPHPDGPLVVFEGALLRQEEPVVGAGGEGTPASGTVVSLKVSHHHVVVRLAPEELGP